MDKQTQKEFTIVKNSQKKEFADLRKLIKDGFKAVSNKFEVQDSKIEELKIDLQGKINELAIMVKKEFDQNSKEHEQNRKEHDENRKEHEEILAELTEIDLKLGEKSMRGDYIDLENRIAIIEKELISSRSVRHS